MLSEASKTSLRKLLWFGLLLYGVTMALCYWVWAQLPVDAQVPTHYGLDFDPDRYNHKNVLLWLPQLQLLVTLLLVYLPRIEPRRLNLERSMKAYVRVGGGIMVFLSAMMLFSAYSALVGQMLTASFLALLMGFLFALIGNYLGKVRSNWFFGIRTPWTLSSELAWFKTHRVTGLLFTWFGLEMIFGGLLWNHPMVLFVGVGGIILSSIYAVIYSWWVWKSDPDKSK